MRCNQATRQMQRELDGRASAPERQSLARHLEGCDACRQAAAGYRSLAAALAADPARKVGDDFESRLFARLEQAETSTPVAAWTQWLSFRASWRLKPALATAACLATAVSAWALLPHRQDTADQAYVQRVIRSHEVVTQHPAAAAAPEQDLVDYSIAQSTAGSITESN